MSDKLVDKYSFALGVCAAFCEVVKAGVKRIALSHPFTEAELHSFLGENFPEKCRETAAEYNCKAYYLKEALITDLFPVSMNLGKRNIVFYRDDRDIAELESIIRDKEALVSRGEYQEEARYRIAYRWGKLLSYSDAAIERYIFENKEKE